jgi:hypothetical protein
LEKITEQIRSDLIKLQETQEKLLNDIAIYNAERTYLFQQQVITEKLIFEIDKDYNFSVENIEEEILECPLCGTIHENSIVNRTSILTDKTQAENQLNEIKNNIKYIDKKIEGIKNKLNEARLQIEKINKKYVIEESEGKNINFNQIIESIAGNSIKDNVTLSKSNKQSEIKQIEEEVRKLTKEQKELVTKETVAEINNSFNTILTRYIKALDAETVNLSEINSPLNYTKVIKEGGAAEGIRSILAYYLTIYTMVEKYGNEIKSALVIDTPNQQEQSSTNYDKIVDLLINQFSNNQIIMSAMQNDHLQPFAKQAKVINLNTDKLLARDKYDEIKIHFE